MLHINKIKDTDPYFIIEPITRAIRNVSTSKTTVIQHDHNSERFTFELPRYIEGHDMMECNLIEVHYENGSEKGIYIVDDLAIIEGEESKLKCTWLLSRNATLNVGALKFLLRFSCIQEDGTVDYAWNTAPYAGITVSTGLYNTEHIEKTYPDAIAELIARIEGIVVGGGGGSADLSNYFTKDEVNENIETLHKHIREAYVSFSSLDNELKDYYTKEEMDAELMQYARSSYLDGFYTKTEADGQHQATIEACESFTEAYVAQEVGNISSALDELHNYAQSLIGGES